jgi:hypothetical protein
MNVVMKVHALRILITYICTRSHLTEEENRIKRKFNFQHFHIKYRIAQNSILLQKRIMGICVAKMHLSIKSRLWRNSLLVCRLVV